jgi:predicted RNA-binding Zn-ribbon protein involved in translation (DUF1610 family)
MDEVESELLKVATELAAASELRLEHTAAEIGELEEQLRQLRAQREGQLDAQSRLNSYRPISATDFRCPNCWIVDGKPALLKSIPFERPGEDIMRCPSCGRDFGISLRA